MHPSVLSGSPFIIATALAGTLEKKFGVSAGEEETGSPGSQQTFETLLRFLKEKDMALIWMSTSLRLARIYLSAGQLRRFDEVGAG